jgi:predicted Zn finger-like uncharacterized protein
MIISCVNCSKKFNINEKLIPENGRMLQCSSCNHKWHYRISEKENAIKENVILSTKNEQKKNKDNEEILIDPSLIETTINKPIKKSNINTYKKIKTNKKELNKEKKKDIDKKNSLINTLNVLLVLIITFLAVILILDTFKNNIANYFPILIQLMDNLYQSFFDIKSFLKDLIR